MAKRKDRAEHDGLTKTEKRKIVNIIGTSVMFVVLALVVYAVIFGGAQRPSPTVTKRADQVQAQQATADVPCPTRAAEPWEFDAASQCYFDPSPGHGHWHKGQSPSPAERAQRMAGGGGMPVQATPVPMPPVPVETAPANPLDTEP